METKPSRDYTHLAIAAVLFCFAAMAYVLGANYVASLMVLGLFIELAAWFFLMSRGPRPYTEIQSHPEGEKNGHPRPRSDSG